MEDFVDELNDLPMGGGFTEADVRVDNFTLQPFKGNLKETRKAIDDIKKAAIALLGDKLILDLEEKMQNDSSQLDINPQDVPTTTHPPKPLTLSEEVDEVLVQAACLRDTMLACLTRLEELNPEEMPELDDEIIRRIADLQFSRKTT